MVEGVLPQIPRIITAFAEWGACVLFIFPQKKRFSKGATALILALACGAQCGMQELAGTFDKSFWIFGMVLNVLLMYGYICLTCKIRFLEVAYWCSVSFMTAEFLAAFEWQISCLLLRNINSFYTIWLICLCIFIFLEWILLIWFVEKRLGDIGKQIGIKQVITTVILTIVAFTMSNIAFLFQHWDSTLIQQWSIYWIRVLVDFCVICILYLQQQNLKEQNYRSELSSIQNVLNLQYKQYLDFKESSEYISRQCHDLKHQIAELRTACTEEERECYLKEMEDAVNLYNGQNVTGNAVLDTLLTRKKIYCLQHQIDFSMAADGRAMSFLSVRDICTIMGNILDNAIEHVSEFENPEEREIQGEIYQKNAFLMIRLENYYKGEAIPEDGLPQTTKMDKQRHGFGLKSVQYSVEKYGGTMTIQPEGNWFVIRILIPIGDPEKLEK